MNKLAMTFGFLTIVTFFPAILLPKTIHSALLGGMSMGFDVATMIVIVYVILKDSWDE